MKKNISTNEIARNEIYPGMNYIPNKLYTKTIKLNEGQKYQRIRGSKGQNAPCNQHQGDGEPAAK